MKTKTIDHLCSFMCTLIGFLLILWWPLTISAQKKKKSEPNKANIKSPLTPPVKTYSLTLVLEGSSKFRIIIPSHPTTSEEQAAFILQDYILKISGAALPILKADQASHPYEILIGQNDRYGTLGLAIDLYALKKDGFIIKTDSSRLIIAGGSGKGSLYGVYALLEKYIGCRMYTPTVKFIPTLPTIVFNKIEDLQVPKIEFRDTHYKSTWDKEYIDWHKLSHDEQGGRLGWGRWVHTFNELLPPDIYFDAHPEYFAEVLGKRLSTQPCLSHPEVLNIVSQNLRKLIAQNPSATYWSVSQNDNRDYCTCASCKKIDDQEGSPSGSIIRFVNQVAYQFQNKKISTLAYEYGRHAPKTLKPADNVNIMLCSIEALRHKPLADDSASIDFVKDLQDWGRIAKDIIIWDYVIQFPNLLSPFPNLHVLQPNLQLFVANGVNAMFEQGNREVGGEFAELRAYLLSKLMWDPYINIDSVMNDFLNGYYGAAGVYIRKYIDEMKSALLLSGKPLRIFGNPMEVSEGYLHTSLMKKYNDWFDTAEKSVMTQPQILERVRIARIPIQFAAFEIAKKNWYGDQGVFVKKNNKWEVRTELRAMIDPFTDLCIRQGVTRVKEWSTSPEEYRSAMYRLFSQGMREHFAFGKKVSVISPDTSMVVNKNWSLLTDGIRGSHDYAYNWFSFQGSDLEVVIDLEIPREIHRIESAYYQYGFWLRLLPKRVEYFTSEDGTQFLSTGMLENTLPIDQYGGQQRDFISEFEPRKARYVKVKAYTTGNTPSWHPGAGRPPYMLIDEIVVE